MSKIQPYAEKVIEFCEASPEGKHMLEKVAKALSTKITYSMGCKFLSEYLGKTLSEIVAEYRADVQENMYEAFDKWEMIFDDFQIYLEKLDYKSASVHAFHAGAKALINTNVPRSLQLKAKAPKVFSRTIPPVTFEDLKEIYDMVNVRERAFIAFLKDSGISASDAVPINLGDLKGLDKNEQWIHLRIVREKEHVEYETFLGPNAVTALKAYLKFRERRGEKIDKETPIFSTEAKPWRRLDAHALKTTFYRIKLKTGITISSHRLRKFFETYMALTVRHPIVLKYWMGHKVRTSRDVDARYIIPPTPEQLKLYKEAYRKIDLIGKSMEERVKAIEEVMQVIPPEQRELMKKHGITMMRKTKAEEEKTETEANGGWGKQKVISEADLSEYLQQGWRVITALPSGNVVIER
jgi:hypothetical protein